MESFVVELRNVRFRTIVWFPGEWADTAPVELSYLVEAETREEAIAIACDRANALSIHHRLDMGSTTITTRPAWKATAVLARKPTEEEYARLAKEQLGDYPWTDSDFIEEVALRGYTGVKQYSNEGFWTEWVGTFGSLPTT